TQPSASTATKELDDLMASLSDFKVKEEAKEERQTVEERGVVVRFSTRHKRSTATSPSELLTARRPSSLLLLKYIHLTCSLIGLGPCSRQPIRGQLLSGCQREQLCDTLGWTITLQRGSGHQSDLERQVITKTTTTTTNKKKKTEAPPPPPQKRPPTPPSSPASTSTTRGGLSTPPPRPPAPSDADMYAVPPPRPPVPRAYPSSNMPPPEAFLFQSAVVSIVPAHHGIPRSPGDDPFTRPPSGGPVKRNDAEYRWDRDIPKYEMYQVVDEAPAKVVEEEPIVVRKPIVVSINMS
ncbi:hypothetical protein Pcinc_040870, partial [Petrolisthes cinctipes]